LVAALATRFHSPASLDDLATRLAGASHHPTIRFWAVTRQEWRPLVLDAWALDGPNGKLRSPDPAAAALVPGRSFYYAEQPELGGRTVYRLTVLDRTPDNLVVATENVTPIRVAIVTLFQPGALQVVSFLHREQPDTWDLYMITRAAEASSSAVAGYRSAYLNRLEAMHRFLMCRPTVILRLRHGEARRISERTKADLKLRLKGAATPAIHVDVGCLCCGGTNACSRRERHASRRDSGSHSQPAHAATNRRSRDILAHSERKSMREASPGHR
jgi:hypothetical protein